jgi:hypothetical protein
MLEQRGIPPEAMEDCDMATKGEVQTETGEMLKGPKPLAEPRQDKATPKDDRRTAERGEADPRSRRRDGDNRTPDEPIGEVAYADRDPAKKKTGEF